MLKRTFDLLVSITGLVLLSPLLIAVMFLIWLQDFRSPLYIAPRVGKNRKIFPMVKLRSMRINADKNGVDSTATNDSRITTIGKLVRRYKLDELTQLWNVLCGHMSLVGPRPNVIADVALYTSAELHLLDVKPGITDFSSIVFADEGDILAGKEDPDLAYNQLIRPWKSRLGLFYIQHQSLMLDLKLIALTILTLISRRKALNAIEQLLRGLKCDPLLCNIALRNDPLRPYAPPGASEIVTQRPKSQELKVSNC